MLIRVDIDNTICITKGNDYKNCIPVKTAIDKINKLFNEGHTIIYWTARGSGSGIEWTKHTEKQLDLWGCKRHGLICGKEKGSFDLIIDDKARRIEEI